MIHEYLIDVNMFAAIRVRASLEEEAKEKLRDAILGADANLGILDGKPIVCEPSIEAMEIIEADGEGT